MRPTGNSAAAAMRRLRKDCPDIYFRVLAGEVSAHAGMIEAGFRKKRERKKKSILNRMIQALPLLADDECWCLRRAIDIRLRRVA
jgi:hypothetical protein